MKKRFLVFAMVLLLSLSALAVTASADSAKPAMTNMVEYAGLSARTTDDFAGLRAEFHVDLDKVEAATGRVIFGAVAATAGTDLDVALTGGAVTAADGVQVLVVYDSEGAATNTYVEYDETAAYAKFAFTVAYFHEQQYDDYLTAKLSFRGFYIVDGVVTYADMAGDTYGASASIKDVCGVEVAKEENKNNIGMNRVIRYSAYTAPLQSSYTHGAAVATGATMTLNNMEAGIYEVYMDGTFGDGAKVNFANAAGAEFGASTKAQTSTNLQDLFMYCTLKEGTNTLTWTVPSSTTISNVRFVKTRDQADGTISVSLATVDDVPRANIYAKTLCAIEECDAKCQGVHYYPMSSDYDAKWATTATPFYSLSEFNATQNFVIRDYTDIYTAGVTSTIPTQSASQWKFTGVYRAKNGLCVLNVDSSLRFHVNAAVAGTYRVEFVLGGSQMTASEVKNADGDVTSINYGSFQMGLSVGDGALTYTAAKNGVNMWRARVNTDLNGGSTPAATGTEPVSVGYVIAGEVELGVGDNIVTLQLKSGDALSHAGYFVLPQVSFVPVEEDATAHTIDLVYEKDGVEHTLSRQVVAEGKSAILPENPLPAVLSGYTLSVAEGSLAVTADTPKYKRVTVTLTPKE